MKFPFYRTIAALLVPLLATEPAVPALYPSNHRPALAVHSLAASFQEQALQLLLINSPFLTRTVEKNPATTYGLLQRLEWKAPVSPASLNPTAPSLTFTFRSDEDIRALLPDLSHLGDQGFIATVTKNGPQ